MKTIKFWVGPALVAAFWLTAASFTVSELATVIPSLTAASPAAASAISGPAIREARRPLSARRR